MENKIIILSVLFSLIVFSIFTLNYSVKLNEEECKRIELSINILKLCEERNFPCLNSYETERHYNKYCEKKNND